MNPMPDDVTAMALQRLESQMAECNARLQDLAKWLAGNGTVGLAEQIRNNADDIKRLRNDVEMLSSPGEDPGVAKARLRLLAEIVVAAVAILSLLLHGG